jgi:hypothetical protein
VPSSETISHEIAEGQSNESASSYLAAGHQRKHKKREQVPPVVKYISVNLCMMPIRGPRPSAIYE